MGVIRQRRRRNLPKDLVRAGRLAAQQLDPSKLHGRRGVGGEGLATRQGRGMTAFQVRELADRRRVYAEQRRSQAKQITERGLRGRRGLHADGRPRRGIERQQPLRRRGKQQLAADDASPGRDGDQMRRPPWLAVGDG